MSDLFLNSGNVSNCNIEEVIESVSEGTMTYGDDKEKYKVTKVEIINGGIMNLYGVKMATENKISKQDIDEIADTVIDIICNNISKSCESSK